MEATFDETAGADPSVQPPSLQIVTDNYG
jgi:hypothetical protein